MSNQHSYRHNHYCPGCGKSFRTKEALGAHFNVCKKLKALTEKERKVTNG